jgi:hypothetical protein
MGINVEFNPDLALRDYSEFEKGNRKEEECVPKNLEKGKVYNFLKKGQRMYWLTGELALLKTKGNADLSNPIASIRIIEATHFLENEEVFTKGKYKVVDVFSDNSVNFNWMKRIE